MKIKGVHSVETDISSLWEMLQDTDVLAKISPGVGRIERVEGEGDRFKAISDISIGPVKGSFEGELELLDKIENETMTMLLIQKSKIGNAEARIVMNMKETGSASTEITYDGKAKVSGTLAAMGQRIMGGVIKTLTKQIFKELDQEIAERNNQSINKTD